MDPLYLVVLYSKHSPQSMKFMSIYGQSPIPHIRPLCIDNKDVRDRLHKSQDINLTRVPSVVFVYPGNKIEHIEGPQIYDWLLEQVATNTPTPPQTETKKPNQPIEEKVAQTIAPQGELLSRPFVEKDQIPVLIDSATPSPLVSLQESNRPITTQEMAAKMQMDRDSSMDSLHSRPNGFRS